MKYRLLQSIIDSELEDKTHTDKYSCTQGLLWLKR